MSNPFELLGLSPAELKKISLIKAVSARPSNMTFDTEEHQNDELEALDSIREGVIDGIKSILRHVHMLDDTYTQQELLTSISDFIEMAIVDTIDPAISSVKNSEIRYTETEYRQIRGEQLLNQMMKEIA